METLTFIVLPGSYSLCRLLADQAIPDWVFQSSFYTVSKSAVELSIVCESRYVPASVQQSNDWRLMKIDAVLDLSLTGITAKFSVPLAKACINLCIIATYDTDYVMVPAAKLVAAKEALEQEGFHVIE
jgi:uncharacterized protein